MSGLGEALLYRSYLVSFARFTTSYAWCVAACSRSRNEACDAYMFAISYEKRTLVHSQAVILLVEGAKRERPEEAGWLDKFREFVANSRRVDGRGTGRSGLR